MSTNRAAVYAELLRELSRMNTRSVLLTQAVADRLRMNPTDLECYGLVSDQGQLTAGQLAEMTGLSTGAITGVLDRLERAGFLKRTPDPQDRRRVVIVPSPGKHREVDGVYESLAEATTSLLATFSDDQLATVLEFMRRSEPVMQQEIARLRAVAGVSAPNADGTSGPFSAPMAGLAGARLEFTAGAAQATIGSDAGLGQDLYRAQFEGATPAVRVQNGVVSIRYRWQGIFDWRRHAAHVVLNPVVPWSIDIRSGVSKLAADLRNVNLRSLELANGASRAVLLMPRPQGAVRLAITGGTSRMQIQRPAGVPVQLRVVGGATKLVFDGRPYGSIGGDTELKSPSFEDAVDRYEIEVRGGASRMSVEAV